MRSPSRLSLRFPARAWAPLSDAELYALLPHLLPRSPRGQRVHDLRTRLDGLFWLSSTPHPWSRLPKRFGRPDTVSRWFRRLCRSGLWEQLLHVLADSPSDHPLAPIASWILRACRRADRVIGRGFQRLIRRLGLLQALPGPPWFLHDPILSETLRRCLRAAIALRPIPQPFASLVLRLLLLQHRPRRLPPGLRHAWC